VIRPPASLASTAIAASGDYRHPVLPQWRHRELVAFHSSQYVSSVAARRGAGLKSVPV
jgi:hypothetical protein